MSILKTSSEVVYKTKRFLKLNFDFKDLGYIEAMLGIKITRIPIRPKISWQPYVEKIMSPCQS